MQRWLFGIKKYTFDHFFLWCTKLWDLQTENNYSEALDAKQKTLILHLENVEKVQNLHHLVYISTFQYIHWYVLLRVYYVMKCRFCDLNIMRSISLKQFNISDYSKNYLSRSYKIIELEVNFVKILTKLFVRKKITF